MIERMLSERYRLEGRIGQGGMGIVYCGFDTVLRRRVAIKILRETLAADADFVARFYSEAQHVAKLSHPNIVSIYDVGREGETYYIVMELVDGATLAEMIASDRRLPEPVAIDFSVQLCSGLAYAHRQGLFHRDVKPANVLITKDDVVKLSDFGIAHAVTTQTMTMTQSGMVMGSVFYISPEQAQGLELHATSDLYSLGVVLYEMISGSLPYVGDSPIAVALKHVSAEVPPLPPGVSASPALAAIVATLLQKNPADRFQSAVDLAKALREARERPAAPTAVAADNGAGRAARTHGIPNPKPRPSRFPDRVAAVAEPTEAVTSIERIETGSNRTLALIFAAIALLIVAIAGGYTFANRASLPFAKPAVVAVADVVGRPIGDARRKLEALGFAVRLESVTSTTVAARKVVREEPKAGVGLAAGSTVALFVSSGEPTVALIDVRHYSREDAERFLRDAKLVPSVHAVYDAAPKGTVLSQKPGPSESITIHSTVALVVSLGPRPIDVPDVVSLTLADARSAATSRHLRIVVGERSPSDQIPADTIMSQSPIAGSQLARGDAISVVISGGASDVILPDVSGKTSAGAVDLLQRSGIDVATEYVVDPTAPIGTVLKQTPDATAPVKKGSTVVIAIAVPGTVPDVAAKNPAEARAVLGDAGYKIGNTAFVQEGTEGTVVRTEPAAGASLRPGETVMLYVSGTPTEPQ